MTSQWQSVTPRDKPLPLHYIFGPELLSQTTLVKQENRVKEIYSLLYWTKMDTSTWNDDVRRQCLEVEITSIFLYLFGEHAIHKTFSSPRQKPRENANIFPPLTLFSFVIVLPTTWDRGKINRSFFTEYTVTMQILTFLDNAIENEEFNFSFGHTIFLFGWICTNTVSSYCYLHILSSHLNRILVK